MYATGSPTDVYHLLSEKQDKTLCGHNVAPIIIDRPVITSALHLTSREPRDRELCRECDAIRAEKSEKGE